MLESTVRENGSRRVQSVPVGESKTEQSKRDEVNINTIVAKSRRGIPPRINARQGLYGDFSSGLDFHTMCNRIADAQLDFMSLPATTRSLFGNDPGQLLDFISDPKNEDKARELNLLPEKPVKAAPPEGVQKPPESPVKGDQVKAGDPAPTKAVEA